MNYLLSITNLILIQVILYFSLVFPKKNIKTLIIFFSISILGIIGLSIGLNYAIIFPIAGLNWNIVFPLIVMVQLLGIIFIAPNKLHSSLALFLPITIDLFTKALLCLFLNISFNEMNRVGYFYFSIYIFLMQVLIEIFIFMIYKLFKDLHTYNDNKYTIFAIIGLSITEVISFILINFNISSIVIINQKSYLYVIILDIILILLFIATIILFYLLQKSIKRKYLQINEYKEKLLEKNYQDIYIESQEELFKLRHDIANIIESIKIHESSEIQEIKNDLSKKLINQKFYYTNHKLLNSILVNKMNVAKEKGISVETNISIDKEIKISNIDLISLFSNLLDNAIEALKNVAEKQLVLEIGTTENTMEILIKNTCYKIQKTKKSNPKYHGFGLKIIKDIVNKYKGDYTSFLENQMYTTMIVIPY